MNERDLEIMQIADDLLTQQKVLIEQQAKIIETLSTLLATYGPVKVLP